jgi:hypothetical protein
LRRNDPVCGHYFRPNLSEFGFHVSTGSQAPGKVTQDKGVRAYLGQDNFAEEQLNGPAP